ncbi:MAG: antibiotic biosynthesis monooxygenase [Pseudomonadota bacterium]
MIIIAATIDYATQEDRDAAVAASLDFQQATRDDEPGCQAYCFAPDPCVPTRIQVHEAWDDGASVAAHLKHQNYFNMRETLGKYGLVNAWNQMYLISEQEGVYDENGQPREVIFGGRA